MNRHIPFCKRLSKRMKAYTTASICALDSCPRATQSCNQRSKLFGLQPHTRTVACPQQQHDACSRASSQEAQQTGVSGGFFNAVQMHMLSMRAAEVKLVCHLQVMQILWFGRTDSSKRGCFDNGVRMRPAVNKPGRPVVGVQL